MEIIVDVQKLRKAAGEPIKLPEGFRVGKLVGSTAYFPVKRSKNFYGVMSSWTLDREMVSDLRGCATVIVLDDSETGNVWAVGFEDFVRSSKQTWNRSGCKLALQHRFWELVDHEPRVGEQLRLFPPAGPQAAPRPALERW